MAFRFHTNIIHVIFIIPTHILPVPPTLPICCTGSLLASTAASTRLRHVSKLQLQRQQAAGHREMACRHRGGRHAANSRGRNSEWARHRLQKMPECIFRAAHDTRKPWQALIPAPSYPPLFCLRLTSLLRIQLLLGCRQLTTTSGRR